MSNPKLFNCWNLKHFKILSDLNQSERSPILVSLAMKLCLKGQEKNMRNMMKRKMLIFKNKFMKQLRMKLGIDEWRLDNQNEFGLNFIKFWILQMLLCKLLMLEIPWEHEQSMSKST